jgi:cytidyltransferase-like protein
MKPYDIGLLVGRFHHFHKGHEKLVEIGLSMCDRMLILVGSSQEWGTLRNPYSVSTRIEMIKAIYEDRVIVKDLPDLTNENDINYDWGRYVLQKVYETIHKQPELMIYGNDEARSRWFDLKDIKNTIEVIVPRDHLSGTELRKAIVRNDFDFWHQNTNQRLHKFLPKLTEELLSVPAYKKMYQKFIEKE